MAERLTKAQKSRLEKEEAAWALLGTAFVKLLRETRRDDEPTGKQAWGVAEWIYEHALTEENRRAFTLNTDAFLEFELERFLNDKEPPASNPEN